MAKYFYRGNKIPTDMTDEIILQTDPAGNIVSSVFRGGNSAEISKTQYDVLKDRFVLELDESDKAENVVEATDSRDSKRKARKEEVS